jgi:hypothetical protein
MRLEDIKKVRPSWKRTTTSGDRSDSTPAGERHRVPTVNNPYAPPATAKQLYVERDISTELARLLLIFGVKIPEMKNLHTAPFIQNDNLNVMRAALRKFVGEKKLEMGLDADVSSFSSSGAGDYDDPLLDEVLALLRHPAVGVDMPRDVTRDDFVKRLRDSLYGLCRRGYRAGSGTKRLEDDYVHSDKGTWQGMKNREKELGYSYEQHPSRGEPPLPQTMLGIQFSTDTDMNDLVDSLTSWTAKNRALKGARARGLYMSTIPTFGQQQSADQLTTRGPRHRRDDALSMATVGSNAERETADQLTTWTARNKHLKSR